MSKNRLAPLKVITIPKLELQAAVLSNSSSAFQIASLHFFRAPNPHGRARYFFFKAPNPHGRAQSFFEYPTHTGVINPQPKSQGCNFLEHPTLAGVLVNRASNPHGHAQRLINQSNQKQSIQLTNQYINILINQELKKEIEIRD